jgi:hypothetical protein
VFDQKPIRITSFVSGHLPWPWGFGSDDVSEGNIVTAKTPWPGWISGCPQPSVK